MENEREWDWEGIGTGSECVDAAAGRIWDRPYARWVCTRRMGLGSHGLWMRLVEAFGPTDVRAERTRVIGN